VLQCVAVYCSELQCVVVCCSVLLALFLLACWAYGAQDGYFVVCCTVLQCIALCCSVLHCDALCCRLLQCVACGVVVGSLGLESS